MLRALAEFRIGGPPTLLGFHAALLTEPCFIEGGTCHGRVESEELAQRADEMTDLFSHRTTTVAKRPDGAADACATRRRRGRRSVVRRSRAHDRASLGRARSPTAGARSDSAAGSGSGAVVSPMQGTVLAGPRGGRRSGRGRAGALRDRGDEDGERDHGAPRAGTVGSTRCRTGSERDERSADLRRSPEPNERRVRRTSEPS